MKLNGDAIILLIPGFPENENDSSCLPAQQSLVSCINRCFPGLQIIVLSFQYPFTSKKYQWHGNQVIPLNGRNRRLAGRFFTWLRAWRALSALHRTKKITGLFSCWMGETALIGHYFARAKGYPHFTWLLGQDALPNNQYVKWIRPGAGSLVAMSDFLADEFFKNHGIRPARVITHGIDPGMFETNLPVSKDIDIVAAGSLIPLKQYDLFIGIIAAIDRQRPGLSVVLCGDGPEKERIQTLIQEYQLGNTIQLTGQLPHAEVLSLMQRSRLLLHPSSYEGFGGVCLEALYAGAHVVSFVQPMRAWIRYWHIANDPADMVRIASDLLREPALPVINVLPYHMLDSAKAVVSLFDHKDAATS